jgi:response regulator RpfG family c-di-GMP phosphodiesterase
MMVTLAKQLGLNEAQTRSAGLLHDLGKALMPMDVLNKPGKLIDAEDFFSTKSNMRILPAVIDLSSPDTGEKIAARGDPVKWHFPDLNELWSGLAKTPG